MLSNPAAWFNVLEMLMTNNGIVTPGAKCLAILTYVSSETTTKIVNIAWKASYTEEDYNNIKQVLIDMHTKSDDARINKFLANLTLGDQKPPELYTKMANIASSISGISVPDKLIFNRWMQELPTELISYVTTNSDAWNPVQHLKSVDNLYELLTNRQTLKKKVNAVGYKDDWYSDQYFK